MKTFNLQKDFIKGWFIGAFERSLEKNPAFEVAVKYYNANDYENTHWHAIAKEYTVIVKGIVKMNNEQYKEGDIIVVERGESTDFRSITDSITVVVKTPAAANDKYTELPF